MEPLVSVLMTAYNRERYIGEAIESVLASTYQDFELIVCDDCSTDNTVAIAEQYAKTDTRVKVYVNPQRLGQFPNRNKVAGYARGKYIKYFDSDDILYKEGLAYCVSEMEKFPQAGMGIYSKHAPGFKAVFCLDPAESMQRHFFKEDVLFAGPSATIILRDAFEKNGGFDPGFGVPSDSFFNIKMAAQFPVVMLHQPFFQYRIHEEQEINNYNDYMVYGYLYFKELLTNVHLPMPEKQVRYLYKKMNKRHAVTILRYLFRTHKLTEVKRIMEKTGFGVGKIFLSLFY